MMTMDYCRMMNVKSASHLIVPLIILISLPSPTVQGQTGHYIKNLANRVYDLLGYETCEHPNVHNAGVKRFFNRMQKELFGQHLAADIMVTAVTAHLEDPDPPKSLVLSLHGWAGAGKTFTTQHLMNSLYHKGINSSFIRFFISGYHFPDPNNVLQYQKLIKRNIEDVVKNCPQALFIFDEVDKTPPGVLDALVPFIHHPGNLLDGHNYKKAIFVFISNTGANDITKITEQAWKDGKKREDLTFKDFSEILSNEAFNSQSSGLYRSRIIDKVLVDFFVPFLPLERRHVISCIKVEALKHGMDPSIIENESEYIADMLTYWPANVKLYSTTGCKKVDGFVKYRIAEIKLAKYKEAGHYSQEDDQEEDEETKTEL